MAPAHSQVLALYATTRCVTMTPHFPLPVIISWSVLLSLPCWASSLPCHYLHERISQLISVAHATFTHRLPHYLYPTHTTHTHTHTTHHHYTLTHLPHTPSMIYQVAVLFGTLI